MTTVAEIITLLKDRDPDENVLWQIIGREELVQSLGKRLSQKDWDAFVDDQGDAFDSVTMETAETWWLDDEYAKASDGENDEDEDEREWDE